MRPTGEFQIMSEKNKGTGVDLLRNSPAGLRRFYRNRHSWFPRARLASFFFFFHASRPHFDHPTLFLENVWCGDREVVHTPS